MSDAEIFLKYNYPETKEMCLHFLTLLTGVLAFSISFAEKVFDFQKANKKRRLIIIWSWCLYLIAIIFCGVGLIFNTIAGGNAAYEYNDFFIPATISYYFIIAAGSIFVLGLGLTIIAAIKSR